MLDVLVPVHEELADGRDRAAGRLPLARRALAAADRDGADEGRKGRASFLGERSIGHMDPGARRRR